MLLPNLSIQRKYELSNLLFDQNGILKLNQSSFFDTFSFEELRAWMHYQGVYGLPTRELIWWLDAVLGEHKKDSIEIGAGNGYLAYHLGIRAFDSKFQLRPEIQKLYREMGQPTINYPDFVQTGEALEVVEKYKPHTVIAQWCTQKAKESDTINTHSCFAGINYLLLLSKVKRLIMIGSEEIHKDIEILNIPHLTFKFDWLRSRRKDNVIWMWER